MLPRPSFTKIKAVHTHKYEGFNKHMDVGATKAISDGKFDADMMTLLGNSMEGARVGDSQVVRSAGAEQAALLLGIHCESIKKDPLLKRFHKDLRTNFNESYRQLPEARRKEAAALAALNAMGEAFADFDQTGELWAAFKPFLEMSANSTMKESFGGTFKFSAFKLRIEGLLKCAAALSRSNDRVETLLKNIYTQRGNARAILRKATGDPDIEVFDGFDEDADFTKMPIVTGAGAEAEDEDDGPVDWSELGGEPVTVPVPSPVKSEDY